jgi:dihydrofolate reductase
MSIALLVAMTADGVIGRAGALPWRLSSDLRRFRELTTGRPIVMGRKTYESIGRPLPQRTMIVVTRQSGFTAPPGVHVVHTIDAAVEVAQATLTNRPAPQAATVADRFSPAADEIFIVGGAELYRQTLDRATRLYVTLVEAAVDGDAYFPKFDRTQWRRVHRADGAVDAKNEYPYSYLVYDRVQPETTFRVLHS